MSRGDYSRLPMYAVSSPSSPRFRSSSRSPTSPISKYPPIPLSSPLYPPTTNVYPPHSNLDDRRRPGWFSHTASSSFLRPRLIITLLKYILPALALAVIGGFFFWEPHIELAFYERAWIQREVVPVAPLSGCFRPERVSSTYNVSERLYGARHTEVQAGLPLRIGLDCYDFAGTVQTPPWLAPAPAADGQARTHFHSYWRVDLAPFGARQEWMLKSFFATQPVSRARFVLWSNGDLSGNPILRGYAERYPDAFELRVADVPALARGTELEGSALLQSSDKLAWTDGDLIRLLVLWRDGGVWVDMDSLLTRDLTPLLEHEFVTQWDCYDKIYQPLNGALMRFHQHSPYLCEAFHIMATSPPPRASSTDWGALLYLKLWRRLVAEGIPPFKILPFCFSDARSCRLDNRLPDPFTPDPKDRRWTLGLTRDEGGGLDKRLQKIFVVHLHNQWEKDFPQDGWVRRLLLQRYQDKLSSSNVQTRAEGEL